MLTVQQAAVLKDAGIKVHSADPEFTATEFNGHRGNQTIPERAAAAMRLLLLPDNRLIRGFFSASRPEPR